MVSTVVMWNGGEAEDLKTSINIRSYFFFSRFRKVLPSSWMLFIPGCVGQIKIFLCK